MNRLDQLLAHYALSHQHPANEAIHCVAVPVIMLTLLGLLYAIHPFVFALFLAASFVYYARLSLKVLVLMVIWSALLTALIVLMGDLRILICITLFILAWIAQFVGHKIEGRKPSFFEDLQYLWVGPLFVARVVMARYGKFF